MFYVKLGLYKKILHKQIILFSFFYCIAYNMYVRTVPIFNNLGADFRFEKFKTGLNHKAPNFNIFFKFLHHNSQKTKSLVTALVGLPFPLHIAQAEAFLLNENGTCG